MSVHTRENFEFFFPLDVVVHKNNSWLTQLFENSLKDPLRFQVQYQLDQWFDVAVIHVLLHYELLFYIDVYWINHALVEIRE